MTAVWQPFKQLLLGKATARPRPVNPLRSGAILYLQPLYAHIIHRHNEASLDKVVARKRAGANTKKEFDVSPNSPGARSGKPEGEAG